jgi:hypothetical protein
MLYNLAKLAPEIRLQIETSPKLVTLFSKFPDKLLTVNGDAKTSKGEKLGYRTAILYLAPHSISGENLCAMAKLAQCDGACLFTAGRGAMSSVFFSRLRKALFFQQYKAAFLVLLASELTRLDLMTKAEGVTLLVRLNGTSDIRWENEGIIQAFPTIQFYDYTKLANRKNIPSNYDLTFSYSGVPAFAPQVKLAITNNMRIAIVFHNRSIVQNIIASGAKIMGLTIVDGDDTDVRHIDPQGVGVALYAKGKGKNDTSGFIYDYVA